MKLKWTPNALEEYQFWKKTDPEIFEWINDLIKDIRRDPFKGLGKPEPLKHGLQGLWSRRITREDRLVYRIEGKGADQTLIIYQCRYHY